MANRYRVHSFSDQVRADKQAAKTYRMHPLGHIRTHTARNILNDLEDICPNYEDIYRLADTAPSLSDVLSALEERADNDIPDEEAALDRHIAILNNAPECIEFYASYQGPDAVMNSKKEVAESLRSIVGKFLPPVTQTQGR